MTQENQLTEITGNTRINPRYVRQQTLQYKTFIKRAIVESLQNAFANHPDSELAKVKIGIDYSTDRADFPAIIVKFYERDLNNIGVGHVEWGPSPADPLYPHGPFTLFQKYYHRIYHGDVEFEIYALSSVDRDKVVDGLIEILTMADVTAGGLNLLDRLYEDLHNTPFGESHFIVFNTDLVTGYGENKEIAPWIPEDTLVYTATYRLPILGEFYSKTPEVPQSIPKIQEVDVYPWNSEDPLDTPPEDFPNEEIPKEDYLKFKGPPSFIFTGDLTNGSKSVKNVSSVENLSVGMRIFAEGQPQTTTIEGIPSNKEIIFSEKATVSVTGAEIEAIVVRKHL